MIQAIVIDDEEKGRESLVYSIEKYCPEVEIIAVCRGPEEGIQMIESLKPSLVFLDIQMPVLSGFDVLSRLSPIDFEVIFVTSYDKYAIKAIRFSALDYLLKPIDVDELIQAVRRAKENSSNREESGHRYESVLHNINRTQGKIERLAIPTLDGIDFFQVEEIIYLQASGSYTSIFLSGKRNQLVSKNLKDFEVMLINQGFCRVHNSYLINMKHVLKYIKGEGGYVILTDDHHVDISRRRKDIFLNLLNRI
ncbi:LytR/AlgR family response regulator transcription factor [Algoriphagus antarcticus]|uniref:LytTR family two component transcriptional regulator n=1 Tax=Algoriphagus antarcticus TaxID=238540 RepID=A0A3E0E3U9_9BACT|nr:LytTR family DNA-binding domain-containing protein [Algoriphagus antarcticus]REG92845.1 LytTR family two component transcriptional regulator [Algoriphagus antarcticus]